MPGFFFLFRLLVFGPHQKITPKHGGSVENLPDFSKFADKCTKKLGVFFSADKFRGKKKLGISGSSTSQDPRRC